MPIALSGYRKQALDDKGRVAIPAKLVRAFRDMAGLSEDDPLEVVLCPTPENRLGVYPRQYFLDWLEKLKVPAGKNGAVRKFRLFLINHMEEQALDKQNRVRIPGEMARNYDLRNEVIVVGSEDLIEIVNEAKFNEQFAESSEALAADMSVALELLAKESAD